MRAQIRIENQDVDDANNVVKKTASSSRILPHTPNISLQLRHGNFRKVRILRTLFGIKC